MKRAICTINAYPGQIQRRYNNPLGSMPCMIGIRTKGKSNARGKIRIKRTSTRASALVPTSFIIMKPTNIWRNKFHDKDMARHTSNIVLKDMFLSQVNPVTQEDSIL